MKVNKHYSPLFLNTDARYFILMGGRGAGRSTTASQYATTRLVGKDYFRCAIMRYVLGDIRNSIFQDIADRIEELGMDDIVNVRDHNLTFESQINNNKINGIGFRKSSSDQKSKLKSLANYSDVIIEEADEVAEEDFIQLDDSLRTVKSKPRITLLLNPPAKGHWIIKRWFNLVPSSVNGFYIPELKDKYKHNTVFISTTYQQNIQNISETSVNNYESYQKTNPDHYYNMIKGYVSEGARGRIFKDWQPISDEQFNELEYKSVYGLDFGFTNDPTALIETKQHNDKVWFNELLYERGLVNRGAPNSISKRLEALGLKRGEDEIIADSAEPKSIEELSMDGWNIRGAEKGKDSVTAGIDLLLSKTVFYTETSDNLITEQENYKWAMNRQKEPTNKPVDDWNHLLDGGRYVVFTKHKEPYVGFA